MLKVCEFFVTRKNIVEKQYIEQISQRSFLLEKFCKIGYPKRVK